MSLNKTLDRLFDEIRREAKRNPEFADRLDAVLRVHASRRDVAAELLEEVAQATDEELGASKRKHKRAAGETPAVQAASALNPAGLYKREGEEALRAALAPLDEAALRALLVEHNLDPAGETAAMNAGELSGHIIAQARRRAERDEKMFDY